MIGAGTDPYAVNRTIEVIQKNNTGTIVIPANPTIDSIASATALYLTIIKLGKNINLACSNPINSDLFAADKFQPSLTTGGNSLVISFPYTNGAIDKVDYNIKGDRFNLIIIPRSESYRLNPQEVKYSYTGGEIDYIIVIDCQNLKAIGPLYEENTAQFQGKDIINIDRHLTNANFGTINLVDKKISSTSQLVLQIIQSLRIEIDKEIATNLYTGILAATNNFSSYSVGPETLEDAALLLKKGAIKKRPVIPNKPSPFANTPATPQTLTMPLSPIRAATGQSQSPISPPLKHKTQAQQSTSPSQEKQSFIPIEEVEKEPLKKPSSPPKDWLKPKIFRGRGII